jgi:UPF0716 protein FxsA
VRSRGEPAQGNSVARVRIWPIVVIVGAIVELFVFVQVANAIGFLWALLALIAVSVVGIWLVKRAGLGVLRRIGEQSRAGQPIGRELVDGLLLLAAGALVAIPGFVSGAAGLVLLLPPLRAALRSTAGKRVEAPGFGKGRIIQATYRVDRTSAPAAQPPSAQPAIDVGEAAPRRPPSDPAEERP